MKLTGRPNRRGAAGGEQVPQIGTSWLGLQLIQIALDGAPIAALSGIDVLSAWRHASPTLGDL
jgi:hypothetical protein